MPKTVGASEAKNRFGAVVEWAVQNRDEVIVESHGRPRAVIMAFEEYRAVQTLRERARVSEALDALETLRREVRGQSTDLEAAEAYRIAGVSESVARRISERDDGPATPGESKPDPDR